MLISETRSRALRREHILYALGAAGIALHTADHLVSDLQRTLLFGGAVALAAFTIGLLPAYTRLTAVAREVVDLVLGATWASAAFVHHGIGLFVGGIAPTDFTGIAAAIGGGLIMCAGLEARRQTERRPHARPTHSQRVLGGGRGS